MARVLIAFATNEGQTAKVAEMLAGRIGESGTRVRVIDLADENPELDLSAVDAVIVAASVHAGKHQESAARFVRDHLGQLTAKRSAFLSVSLYAASSEEGGRDRADEQMKWFLDATGWRPDLAQTIAGAVRYSTFSRPWKWIMRGAQKIFGKELRKDGWPDLTTDREFTDWAALSRFADGFCAELRGSPTPGSVSGAVNAPGKGV